MSRIRSSVAVSSRPAGFKPFVHGSGEAGSQFLSNSFVRIARGLVTGVALLLLLAASTLLIAQNRYDGKVYPAVSAGNVSLGGKSKDDARAALEAEATARESQTVTLSFEDKTWNPTFAELGVSIDVDRSLDAAYSVGREETARSRITKLTSLLSNDEVVPLYVIVDHAKLGAWYDKVDADLGRKPHDASLVIDGANVSIEPELEGTVVDRDAMTTLVTQGAHDLTIANGDLSVVATIAKVRAGDLESARDKVATALSKPVKLTYSNKKWTLDPEQLGQFVTQEVDPSKQGADAFSVGIDESSLASWLNGLIADQIEKSPVDAKVAWSDKKQGLVATTKSRKGAKLKPLSLAREVIDSFWGNHASINVPVTVLEPDVDSNNLGALGVTSKLAVGDSAFVGSNEGRATNIVVGSGLLNGTLIPPHGSFSFNHSIGVIDVDKGYVEAQVIQGERIGRDVGGGICQVSTTVFRAALYAGVPIVEWWPHTYRLGFYELDGWQPGFDASILQPNDDPFSGGDFRFDNPTDSWMLVESYTEDERVYVIIYGADTGYSVSFTTPQITGPIDPPEQAIEIVDDTLDPGTVEQSELAQAGWEVDYDRIVTDKDGNEILRDNWDTVFSSRPDVWKVSPDMQGQSPGAS